MTKDQKKILLADFLEWAEDIHHYTVVEAIERYLKQLKSEDEE